MKLKGREKFFWERNFNIKNAAAIPTALKGITGIDSSHDDEFFFFLTSRVTTIPEIHLRCTNITDLGVQYICRLQGLRQLTLKDHRHITKNCLPDINKLVGLEYLDISKNDIAAKDLLTLTGPTHLKELFISSEMPENELAPTLERLKVHFPGCEITVH